MLQLDGLFRHGSLGEFSSRKDGLVYGGDDADVGDALEDRTNGPSVSGGDTGPVPLTEAGRAPLPPVLIPRGWSDEESSDIEKGSISWETTQLV
jgi:hypothetical protein